MNKKIIFICLILTLVFTFTSINADTITIMDINKSSGYAKESILALADMGIVKGDNLGNFNPTKSISRAEFVTLLVRVLELDTENVPANATFKDVPKNHWAFKYVEAAYRAGIVNGVSPTEFGAAKTSTREQMAVMFVRALKLVDQSDAIELKNIEALADKNSISSWAKKEVDIALTAGLMNGVSPTSFAPKNNATKEQTAVVIDRFIKNEDAMIGKVNTTYGINTEVKLILNGDTVSPTMFVVDENKNAFVTKTFIDKYVLNNSELKVDIKDNGEIFINLEGEYANKSVYTLWFKAGSKNAYKNIELTQAASPYANEEQNKTNLAALEVAPIVKDGNVLIPAKDLANMLGATFTFDAARNKAYIEDANIAKYPNLYYAVQKDLYDDYVGNVEIIADINMTDLATKEFMNTHSEMFSTINKEITEVNTYTKLESDSNEPMEFETNIIMTADKVYELDYDNKWIEYSKSEWESAGGLGAGDPLTGDAYDDGTMVSPELLADYYNLPIQKTGIVQLANGTADKYVINLDSQGIKQLLADSKYNETKATMDALYHGTEKYEIEFYVADGQTVRQVIRFSGLATDDATDLRLDIKMAVDVIYSNIGVAGNIVLPQPSEIKQPEQN